MKYVSSSVTEGTIYNFNHNFNKEKRDTLSHINHDDTDQNIVLKVPRLFYCRRMETE